MIIRCLRLSFTLALMASMPPADSPRPCESAPASPVLAEASDSGEGPIEIAPGVWWVGCRLPDDRFQCHSYYLREGDQGVLIDPGSPLTIETTLAKVASIDGLEAIRYLVCHHSDPDIAASLPLLSQRLERPDVQVVTEWRAQALLHHYGHRFSYYLVEQNGWRLPLTPERSLEFQLTPYLHFPGAIVSYDTATQVLFSSDLFGGFVPDSSVLICDDVDMIVRNTAPFHQHYMPSTELLAAGLTRIQQRWSAIALIAPQHGHLVPAALVEPVIERIKRLQCGVFALADADMDLRHLLEIARIRSNLLEVVLAQAHPAQLLQSLRQLLQRLHGVEDCRLSIELPDHGWTSWGSSLSEPTPGSPPAGWVSVRLGDDPPAVLSILPREGEQPDSELLHMLIGLAPSLQPWIDAVVQGHSEALQIDALQRQAFSDPLTGLGNRRALQEQAPVRDYALLSFDIDHFKRVNDTCGHSAGDAVLCRVADVLLRSVRVDDRVYRLGGEEFLVVLPHCEERVALAIGDRVRDQVRALDLAGLTPTGRVTISAGLFVSDPHRPRPFEAALAAADEALYLSKTQGRDRMTVAC